MTNVRYQLSNLEQRYGSRTVLRVPDLSIHDGEILAIVGPSGAGKSTLLRLLGLLEAPSLGDFQLHVNHRHVNFETASIYDRRQVGMVFQRPLLLSRSVQKNVAYGLRLRGQRDSATTISAMLERVDLKDLANAQPHTLSGGEMQRVALARVLILQPQILLLDEPTANLDPANVRLIESLVREQHAEFGTTIVMVTHNVFQAKRLATRVALFIEGDLIEVGPTEDFFNHPQDPRTAEFVSGDFVY